MSYNLHIENNGHYLHVTAFGTRNRETIVPIIREVIDECAKQSVDEILFDAHNLEGRISISDSYLIASKDIPKLVQPGAIKKLVLVDSDKRNERLKFFGRIARGFGLNIHIFKDINEAKESMELEKTCKS
ncbi:MAG: hypothetical protein GY865_06745 [candidate division Zixibacteria bacterium]|nr:hypothetical protein [candidate division Zixibacteria bacterium]